MTAHSKKRMSDLCEITSSKRIFAADYKASGVPFFRGKEITEKYNGALEVTTELFIDRSKYEEIKSKFGVPKPGDLLLTSVGTLGSTYVVRSKDEFYFKDGNLTWFRSFRGLDSTYLHYWLSAPQGRAELKKCTIGSSQSAYTIALLKGMEIELPSLPEQRRIVSILSAYDDLIENNTRRIAILEEMARRIYEEWFVRFRFPGHENVRMIESELGSVPQGWATQYFAALLESWKGGDWGSDEPSGSDSEPVFVIRGTDFDDLRGGTGNRVPRRFIEKKSLERRKLKPFDLVVENSINAKSRSVGCTLLITHGVLKRLRGDAVAASFCKVFRFHTPQLAVLAHMEMRHLFEIGKMAFFQNVAANGIANFQAQRFVSEAGLTMPTDPSLRARLVDTFVSFTSSTLADTISNLRATRDLLLPKLISGELDVSSLPEPEAAVA